MDKQPCGLCYNQERAIINKHQMPWIIPNLLSTIIRNLLNNAIKYNVQNGEIEIISRMLKDAVEISVKDTGVGIPQEQLFNIFKLDKVFTTPGTYDEKGSGLGLILCKEFVDMHEGEIWAESQPDKGTVIRFTIPFMD